LVHSFPVPESDDIKNQVHYLNQCEECARKTAARNWHLYFRMKLCCFGGLSCRAICFIQWGGGVVQRWSLGLFNLDGSDETVPTARQSFDKAGIRSRIVQSVTDLVDRSVQAVIKIDKSVSRPDLLSQLLPGHDLSWVLQELSQNLKRLLLKSNLESVLAQLAC